MSRLFAHLKEEWLFYSSLLFALLSSLIFRHLPRITSDEWRVLFVLFLFLLITNGLKEVGLLSWLAYKGRKGRYLGLKLVLLTGLLSMFTTNDVALMVMVPLSLSLKVDGVERLLILETISANGLSALSPIGNPQNIFIYNKYSLSFFTFVKAIAPFGLLVLFLLVLLSPKELSFKGNAKEPKLTKEAPLAVFFFFLFLGVALKFLPLYLGLLPVFYALVLRRELLRVDYFLLGTFLAFFAFTDNLSHGLKLHLSGPLEVFFASSLLSQLISNVPAALTVSEFTENWKALLWGVSVGGFGTLVASLANLITYKLYSAQIKGGFLLRFHLYNFLFFLLGSLLFLLITYF